MTRPDSTHTRRRRPVRRAGIIGLVLGAFIGCAVIGISLAQWSINGSGTTKAKATTVTNLVLTGVTPVADLFPGSSGAVSFTVQNPNPFAVTVTGLSLGTVSTSDPLCTVSNLTTNNVSGLNLSVAANSTSSTFTVNSAVSMLLAAPDACQGVTWTIQATATATQN